MNKFVCYAAILIMVQLLTACGQTGALYLPEKSTATQQEPTT